MAQVFAIRRGTGSDFYTDKGGRRTKSIPQIFLWNEREKAQSYLDGGGNNMYVWPQENLDEFVVVPVSVHLQP